MSIAKEIENISPFNELYYKNCFYSSFIPIVRYFNLNLASFLANDIDIYSYKDFDYLSIIASDCIYYDFKELCSIEGLQVDTEHHQSDMIDILIDSIDQGKLAVISVDTYYSPLRKDTFNKQHLGHYLLVYGYSKELEEFHIVEHKNADHPLYEKKRIKFNDLQNCYEGFMNNCKDFVDRVPLSIFGSINQMCALKREDDIDAKDIYQRNYLKNQDAIRKGIENAKLFSDNFAMNLNDGKWIMDNYDKLLKSVNNIINKKKSEQFRLKKIYSNDLVRTETVLSIIESSIEDWSHVREWLVRIYYSKGARRQRAQEIEGIICKFVEVELSIHNEIVSIISM